MKTYKIHFVRHGLTSSNEKGLFAGQYDAPLSEKGISALHALKEKYEYPQAPILYCSPLQRCLSTAEILYPEKTPIVIDQLKECSFGDWENKGYGDLEGNKEFHAWLEGDVSIAPPNGESVLQFGQRVGGAFCKIITGMMKIGQTEAIIVTHGGVIMSLLSMYGLPKRKMYDWLSCNGCGYSVRITPSLWMRDNVMEIYSEVPYGHPNEVDGDFGAFMDTIKGRFM